MIFLRYFTQDQELVPTPQEAALQEIAITEIDQRQAQQEKLRAETLANYLRSLGVDPDQIKFSNLGIEFLR